MKILFAASEVDPFIKTGGLGDVSRALPKQLAMYKENEICVFLPYYKSIKLNRTFPIEFVTCFPMYLAWRISHVGVFRYYSEGVTYYFIDNEYYFFREGAYGNYDDGERFAYFSKAILESLPHINFFPDIIHCNDWQTGLIPLLLKSTYGEISKYSNIKTVFTIHNIEYQGRASVDFLSEVLGISDDWTNAVTFDNCMNFMKSAIVLCDKITTVSRTYSYEIRHDYYAHSLSGVLNDNAYKIEGIVNGIDTSDYNSQTDSNISVNFREGDLNKKRENKIYLQKKLGLDVNPDIPMLAMITRLESHKGLELVEYVAGELEKYHMQIVVLGTGDVRFENLFTQMQNRNPHKISANIFFDSHLAREIYAGADLLLMPSKSEPCGLSQLIAMRYGAIPIVRETGGLVDTVPPINTETLEGRGFTFKSYNAHDMLDAINRALALYYQKDKLSRVVKNIMQFDSSWQKPAEDYMRIYYSLIL